MVAGKTLEDYDVIITTFQTVASEYAAFKGPEVTAQPTIESDGESDDSFFQKIKKKSAAKKKKAPHALFDVKWLRVVVGTFHRLRFGRVAHLYWFAQMKLKISRTRGQRPLRRL